MDTHRLDELLAASYNLHVGKGRRGDRMTPAKAAKLKRADRAQLARILMERGGSAEFSQAEAREAFDQIASES
jgi:hypothetical protein